MEINREKYIQILEKIDNLIELESNWDGCGGNKINIKNITLTNLLFNYIINNKLVTIIPNIIPLNNGGINIKWNTKYLELEISINNINNIFVCFKDLNNKKIDEYNIIINIYDIIEIRNIIINIILTYIPESKGKNLWQKQK